MGKNLCFCGYSSCRSPTGCRIGYSLFVIAKCWDELLFKSIKICETSKCKTLGYATTFHPAFNKHMQYVCQILSEYTSISKTKQLSCSKNIHDFNKMEDVHNSPTLHNSKEESKIYRKRRRTSTPQQDKQTNKRSRVLDCDESKEEEEDES